MSVKWNRRKFIVNGLRAGLLLGAGKGIYNATAHNIELTNTKIHLQNLPPSFKGFKIAQLTDIHSSKVVSARLIKRAAEMTMTERPDAIFLTGDFISGSTKVVGGSVGEFDSDLVDKCIDALSLIEAPNGIFAVFGNHDFWSGKKAIEVMSERFTRHLGVKWLRNSNEEIKKGEQKISILGVDDYWQDSCSITRASNGLDAEGVRLLLSHNPDINEMIDAMEERVDLVVSDHTHGGQITIPFLGAPYMPSKFGQKYRAGLVRDGKRQTYVSRGVGHLLVPLRMNCPPEVSILTLV